MQISGKTDISESMTEVNDHPQSEWLDRYASLFKGKLSGIDIFLSGKPRPLGREASISPPKAGKGKSTSVL
jgi:hypothetical protein